MAKPTDAQDLVDQLLAGASPQEHKALLDVLLSGRVSSILEEMERDEAPTLLPVPTEVRGFRVRLDLCGAKPPVWRRLELPGDLSLTQLHDVIQAAMGWTDSHLHRFRTGNDHRSAYFVTPFDMEEGEEGTLEADVRLDQIVAQNGEELWYEYDFGDGWDHRLRVEEVLEQAPPTARCTGGRMACPPEDCGGIGGYEDLAAWVRSGRDDRLLPGVFDDAAHADEWLPPDWHPDRFDIEESGAAVAAATHEPVAVTEELAELAEAFEQRGSRLLRGVLSHPSSHGPTAVSDIEAARLTEVYQIFLDVIGDGVTLTGAGYLPPAVVERFAQLSGISGWWIGKVNREDLTPPVADVRATARSLGLVSVRKGRLTPTAAIRAHRDPQSLWRHIVRRLPLGTKEAERQAGWVALAVVGCDVPASEWPGEISDLLFDLGWRNGFDQFVPPPANSSTLDVLHQLAGVARVGWSRKQAIEPAIAATARAAIRGG